MFLFDFTHRLNYKTVKLPRFESWILLPSSGARGKRTEEPVFMPLGWANLSPGQRFENWILLPFSYIVQVWASLTRGPTNIFSAPLSVPLSEDKHNPHYQIRAFWDVAPCSLVEIDWHFIGAYCFHHECDESQHWLWRQYSPHFTRKSLRGVLALVRFGVKVYWWVD
jgi:hypothetical protein